MIRFKLPTDHPPIECEVITDPILIAEWDASLAAYAVNSDWFQAHVAEIATANRGKHVSVAGREVFAADTHEAALAAARAKHPDDRGIIQRFIPAIANGPGQ